jgi:hypothetical protein
MKKSFGWWGICVLLATPSLVVRAGNPPPPAASAPTAATTLHAPPAPPVSTVIVPADGTGFSTTDPEQIAEQTMEMQAERKQNGDSQPSWQTEQQQEASRADQNDWMLRDYEAGLKKAGLSQTADTDPAAVSRATDPQSAAIGNPLDAINDDPTINPEAESKPSSPQPGRNDASQPPDATKLIQFKSLTSFQPLLPPLDSPAAAPHDPWGGHSAADATAAITNMLPPSNVAKETENDSSSLDVPGLTAAQSGMGPATEDLGFQDPLPDESTDTRQKMIAERNNFMGPTAPTGDVSEFFKKQSEALQPPTAPNAVQPLTVLARPVSRVAPEPTAKPAMTGLRSHVDDPFDYLHL